MRKDSWPLDRISTEDENLGTKASTENISSTPFLDIRSRITSQGNTTSLFQCGVAQPLHESAHISSMMSRIKYSSYRPYFSSSLSSSSSNSSSFRLMSCSSLNNTARNSIFHKKITETDQKKQQESSLKKQDFSVPFLKEEKHFSENNPEIYSDKTKVAKQKSKIVIEDADRPVYLLTAPDLFAELRSLCILRHHKSENTTLKPNATMTEVNISVNHPLPLNTKKSQPAILISSDNIIQQQEIEKVKEEEADDAEGALLEWHPVLSKKKEMCHDIDMEIDGQRKSEMAEYEKEKMIREWKDLELSSKTGEYSQKYANSAFSSTTNTTAPYILSEIEADSELERHNLLKMSQLEKDKKAKLLIVKRELEDAKRHFRVYGEWVRKDWITDDEEKELWDKAEYKMMCEKAKEEDGAGHSKWGHFTIEELKSLLRDAEDKEMTEKERGELVTEIARKEKKLEKQAQRGQLTHLDRYLIEYTKWKQKERKKRGDPTYLDFSAMLRSPKKEAAPKELFDQSESTGYLSLNENAVNFDLIETYPLNEVPLAAISEQSLSDLAHLAQESDLQSKRDALENSNTFDSSYVQQEYGKSIKEAEDNMINISQQNCDNLKHQSFSDMISQEKRLSENSVGQQEINLLASDDSAKGEQEKRNSMQSNQFKMFPHPIHNHLHATDCRLPSHIGKAGEESRANLYSEHNKLKSDLHFKNLSFGLETYPCVVFSKGNVKEQPKFSQFSKYFSLFRRQTIPLSSPSSSSSSSADFSFRDTLMPVEFILQPDDKPPTVATNRPKVLLPTPPQSESNAILPAVPSFAHQKESQIIVTPFAFDPNFLLAQLHCSSLKAAQKLKFFKRRRSFSKPSFQSFFESSANNNNDKLHKKRKKHKNTSLRIGHMSQIKESKNSNPFAL